MGSTRGVDRQAHDSLWSGGADDFQRPMGLPLLAIPSPRLEASLPSIARWIELRQDS